MNKLSIEEKLDAYGFALKIQVSHDIRRGQCFMCTDLSAWYVRYYGSEVLNVWKEEEYWDQMEYLFPELFEFMPEGKKMGDPFYLKGDFDDGMLLEEFYMMIKDKKIEILNKIIEGLRMKRIQESLGLGKEVDHEEE